MKEKHETNSPAVASEQQHSNVKPNHIEVAVITTSGSWPAEGFESVPLNQPVKTQLQQAAKKLELADTSNWIAKIGLRELDASKSYEANNLSGKVEIDYGPREGGGGNA